MPIVTTSSRQRPRRSAALPIVVLGVLAIGVVAYLLLREGPASSGPSIGAAPSPQPSPAAATDGSGREDTRGETDSAAATGPVRSPMIIRPGQKGEPKEFPLTRTGTVIRAVAGGTGINPSTNVISRGKAVFHNRTEQFIYKYANSAKRPTMLMPSFGADSEEEIRRILETDIVVYDDDDEETVAVKENVAALKQDLLKAIEEGYGAAEILSEMREDNNRRVRGRFKMQRQLNSLIKSNMVDRAVEYFNEANVRLADEFLPPLVFPEDKLPEQREK